MAKQKPKKKRLARVKKASNHIRKYGEKEPSHRSWADIQAGKRVNRRKRRKGKNRSSGFQFPASPPSSE